jgi:5-methylcytosine-specific restriction enzyme A
MPFKPKQHRPAHYKPPKRIDLRPNAQERGYTHAWQKQREAEICDEPFCAKCGRYHKSNERDHIIPKRSGGSDDKSNLQTLCRRCHAIKTREDERTYGKPND